MLAYYISLVVFVTLNLTVCKFMNENEKKTLLENRNETYKIRLLVFSSGEDPEFVLGGENVTTLATLLESNTFKQKESTRVMGYMGFLVTSEYPNSIYSFTIKGAPYR